MVIDIPQELCEQKSLFKDVASLETWDEILSNEQRAHLMKFLPTFPENDSLRKRQVIRDLFNGSNFKFGNPVDNFHKKLKDGLLSPEMAKMTSALSRAKHREYVYQQQHYFYKLLQEILISRKRLLEAAALLPPDQPVRMERIQPKPMLNSIEQRTKRKYLRELQELREEVGELATSSEDENYPEGAPPKLTKRQKRQMMQLEVSLNSDAGCVMSTLAPKSNTSGPNSSSALFARSISPFELTEETYREMLINHKRRRMENEFHPELDVRGITLHEVGVRTNVPKRSTSRPELSTKKKGSKEKEKPDKKKSSGASTVSLLISNTSTAEPFQEKEVKNSCTLESHMLISPKIEPCSPPAEPAFNDHIPTEAEFNDGLAMECDANTEPELEFSLSRTSAPSLAQGIHASFFGLLRDLMCATSDTKVTLAKLEEKVQSWQESPFSALNEWFGLNINWSELVHSALKFLSGEMSALLPENFIPFIDHKDRTQIWCWAGEGRDSDDILTPLTQHWLEIRQDEETIADSSDAIPGSPLPARVHTNWAVRPTTEDEKTLYRDQERFRYENPHKAFTFSMHSYEAVVGPVKGVYGKDAGMNKAREHSLLISDRPPFVTILSLVRDAAARLPNGEGTRADICELLKDSQFLAPATDSQIHTVVSGALDRLHYEKDPCVKYDVNRKMWIYLHRNRTEEEYERIHHAQATAAKTKKVVQKSKVKQVKNKTSSRPASSLSTASTDSLLSLDLVNPSVNSSSALPTPAVSTSSAAPSPRTGANSPRVIGNQHSPKVASTVQITSTLPILQPSVPKQPCITSSTMFHPLSNIGDHTLTSVVPSLNSANLPILGRSTSVPVTLSASIKVETPDLTRTASSNETMITSPFIMPSSQNSLCPTSVSSLSSPKSVLSGVSSAQLVNITQVQLVSGTGGPQPTGPIMAQAATTKMSSGTVLAHLTSPHPPKTVGAIMALQAAAAAAKAVTVNTQAIGTVKLVPSGLTQTQTCATLAGRPLTTSMVAHSVSSAAIQGMPTIVIKQEGSHQHVTSSHATKAAMASSKPVVARIISPPQVVSVGNLIASTLAATQKQGNQLQGGTTTIKIQGSNLIRPLGGKPSHLNMLQTSAATVAQNTLPRLAIVSQSSTANLIPVSGTTVTTQPKLVATSSGQIGIVTSQLTTQQATLSNVTKPTILTTPAGIKIVSATAAPSVSLAQLTGKTTQAVMVTTKQQTPSSVTVTMGTSVAGTQNLILTGGMQSSSPTVVIASQRAIKPAQTVVMAPGGTSPTVVMATQPSLRPLAATAVTSVNMKAIQGVKVIPVTQATVGTKGKVQPVFARIITPPASLTLRPGLTAAAAAQQGIGVIHAMAHVPTAAISSATAAALSAVRTPTPPKLAQATIIRVQSPQTSLTPTILHPDRLSKEPQ